MKSKRKMTRVVFVTGADTGAGKSLLTALLLEFLRSEGVRALAMKPFCSGSLEDVELLSSVQNQAISCDLVNPFYFPEPVAPLVSARKHGRKIGMKAVLEAIEGVKKQCDCLLIEGSGGLLVPLGEGFSVRDLIAKLGCPVVVAARNKLGVINHTRLTVDGLQLFGIKDITVVLMGGEKWDISTQSNAEILAELVWPVRVFSVPFLGKNASRKGGVKKSVKKIKKTIAQIGEAANVSSFFTNRADCRRKTS